MIPQRAARIVCQHWAVSGFLTTNERYPVLMKKKNLLFSLIALVAINTARSDEEPSSQTIESSLNPLVTGDGRAFEGRLAPHESIYFLYGSDAPAAKFQFSFKYRLLDFQDKNNPRETTPSINLAFTQRSLWDVDADSSPFYDTSYMPEIMFESARKTLPEQNGPFTWYGYQAAYKHESNGQDSFESRSLDILYVRPIFSIGPRDKWHAIFLPEAFVYLKSSDENPDIEDYRGYGQLRGAISKGDGLSLGYTLRAGKDFDRFTYQLDLLIPIEIDFLSLGAYLQVQYFSGYGESLLSYQEESDAIRVGLSIVR